MKSAYFFYAGVAIDGFALLLSLSNYMLSRNFENGLTPAGHLASILIPLALLVLIGLAFWLRAYGKMLLANILLWIPALPLAGAFLLWGGLAILFILFGK